MKIVLALLFSLLPTFAFAETLTIQTNQEASLTECTEDWPYDFDCVDTNGQTRCLQPPGTDPAIFKGFPPCTPFKTQTGILFPGEPAGRIYSVKAGENEFRFVGVVSQLDKPRTIRSNGLEVRIVTEK